MITVTPSGIDLKALRRRLGLSQRGLAELVGAHAMTVSRWERGLLRPSAHQDRLLRSLLRASESVPLETSTRDARNETAPGGAGAAARRHDPTRALAELLARAHGQPELELGTLSATNRFPGRVVELARGDIMSKVVIEIAGGLRMGAVITTDSVDRLGLDLDSRAIAIIKATEVIVGGA
jgi:molybdopterin-binding protein